MATVDERSCPKSGPVSTRVANIREFESRSHSLGILSATLANSAWSSLQVKQNEYYSGDHTHYYGRNGVFYDTVDPTSHE